LQVRERRLLREAFANAKRCVARLDFFKAPRKEYDQVKNAKSVDLAFFDIFDEMLNRTRANTVRPYRKLQAFA
jgi:hypothetical protein